MAPRPRSPKLSLTAVARRWLARCTTTMPRRVARSCRSTTTARSLCTSGRAIGLKRSSWTRTGTSSRSIPFWTVWNSSGPSPWSLAPTARCTCWNGAAASGATTTMPAWCGLTTCGVRGHRCLALKLRLPMVLRRWRCISRGAIPLIPIRGRCWTLPGILPATERLTRRGQRLSSPTRQAATMLLS